MAETNIPSTPIDGNYKAVLIPEVADINAITATEANAGIDVSCYLTGDGLQITVDEATISDERLCSSSTFEKRGRKTHAVQSTYIDNTNNPDYEEYNEAREACDEEARHVLVTRRNLPFDTAFASGQIYRAYPIECGFPAEVPVEANSVTRTTQKWFVTGEPAIDKPIASAGGGA